jgi:hypothetical protein
MAGYSGTPLAAKLGIEPGHAIHAIEAPPGYRARLAPLPEGVPEDVVRATALPIGLVDVKVCAVDDVWSGLKLVVRKALR